MSKCSPVVQARRNRPFNDVELEHSDFAIFPIYTAITDLYPESERHLDIRKGMIVTEMNIISGYPNLEGNNNYICNLQKYISFYFKCSTVCLRTSFLCGGVLIEVLRS
jgi:hypothetical protein